MRDTHRDVRHLVREASSTTADAKPLFSLYSSRHPAKCTAIGIVLGGTCALLLCSLAGVGLGTLILSRDARQFIFAEQSPTPGGIQQSTKWTTGTVQTLDDILRTGHLPRTLLKHSDVEFCPNIPEPQTDEIYAIPEKVNIVMLIGTQKTGTTWLFEALFRHPSFISAIRRPGEDKALVAGSLRAKEPQYFNRWPLPSVGSYLHAWHSGVVGAMVSDAAGRRVLLDASPQYLMTAAAPPRILAAAPHARFILVVRDGPIRTLSDFKMMGSIPDCSNNPSRLCPVEDFLDQVQHELNDPQWNPDCYFNGSDPTKTWFDCHRCGFGYIDQRVASGACAELERSGPPEFRNCSTPSFRFIDHGLYAAQLAWWLRFFPPERFLIISSWQLRDPVERVQVLNRVLDHTGMTGAQLFTAELVEDVQGFVGQYARNFSERETTALEMLREYFRTPQDDLKRLVDMFWPEVNFRIEHET